MGFAQKTEGDAHPNEGLIGEENSGPLPKRQLRFRSDKNGTEDQIQLKYISANRKKSNEF
jgi:hypothetical protein